MYILLALAKHAKELGAYKLARDTLEKLQTLRLPAQYLDQIDLATIAIRAKPFSDKEACRKVIAAHLFRTYSRFATVARLPTL